MKHAILFAAMTVGMLAGCEGQAPAPNVSQPATAAAPTQSAPATVAAADETKIGEFDATTLTKATWTGKACDVKVPDGTVEKVVTKGSANLLEGYVIDPSNAPAGEFEVVLKGEKSFSIPASTGASRPDVAEFFKIPALATSGFQFTTTLESIPAGRYSVDFVMDRAGTKYFCESGKTLIVQ
jgi:hypothetical protein